MNPLEALFGQVQNAINEHGSPDTPGPSYDTGGLLGTLAGLFGQHAQQNGENFDTSRFGNVQSSNQDPYGDPGAQSSYGNVKSSNEDPYGDPGARGR
jgi:hypothetical protein